MALSDADREFFQLEFHRLHDRLDDYEERTRQHSNHISAIPIRVTEAIENHEKEHHDTAKKVGFIATVVALGVGIFEGGKAIVSMIWRDPK